MTTVEDFSTLMMQRPVPQRGLVAMRKCASTPTLTSLGEAATDENGIEVYVVLNNFREFAGGVFHRLPTRLRDGVRDAGICHYTTVFRQQDGSLVQFDFGPSAGGDIHVSAGPFTRFINKSSPTPKLPSSSTSSNRNNRAVGGKVREHKLTSLPDSHLYVGRTHLSMSDIRAWNSVHASCSYELHRSDCRHYVNSLVHYTTGVEKATTCALRNQWVNNKHRYGLGNSAVRLGHFITDVANWEKVRAVGHATTAVLMAITGQHALAKLRATPFIASVQRRLVPAGRKALVPVPRAIVQRPAVAVGATAVATSYAASGGQTPGAVRDTLTLGARVAGGVQSALRAAATLAEHVGRTASAATMQTTNTAVALASGIAGAASRGTSGMMMTRPKQVFATAAVATASIDQRSSTGSPLKARLPGLKNRTQQLALVAARR